MRSSAARQERLGLQGIRLALVEHDRDLREVLTLLVEWLGGEVVTVDDAHVMVCDEQSAARGALAHANRAGVPVVLLSGGLDADAWLVSPRLVVLEKPVTPSTLVREVRGLLDRLR